MDHLFEEFTCESSQGLTSVTTRNMGNTQYIANSDHVRPILLSTWCEQVSLGLFLVVPFSVCRAVLEQCAAHLQVTISTGSRAESAGRSACSTQICLCRPFVAVRAWHSSLNSYNLYIDL